jgi:hypothetical protein
VTEQEWLNCTKPGKMMEFLRNKGTGRKRRLLAVACCWRVLEWMPQGCRPAVEVAERCAEGLATEAERREAFVAAGEANEEPIDLSNYWAGYCAYRAVETPSEYDHPTSWKEDAAAWVVQTAHRPRAWIEGRWDATVVRDEKSQITDTIRDIFGNVFRTISISPAVLAWNDAVVVRLAQAVYDERDMPAGTLDSGRLAVLADALEEAGCTSEDILGHLRGAGPHVRGCWPVDLCLGKS